VTWSSDETDSLFDVLVEKTRRMNLLTGIQPKDVLGFLGVLWALFFVHTALGLIFSALCLLIVVLRFHEIRRGPRVIDDSLELVTLVRQGDISLLFSDWYRVIQIRVHPSKNDDLPARLGVLPDRIIASLSRTDREAILALGLPITLHPSGILAPSNLNRSQFDTLLEIAPKMLTIREGLVQHAVGADVTAAVRALIHLDVDHHIPPSAHQPWVDIARAAHLGQGLQAALEALDATEAALALRGVFMTGVVPASTFEALVAALDAEPQYTEAARLKRWTWLRALERDADSAFDALLAIAGPLTIRALNPISGLLNQKEKGRLMKALQVSGGQLSLDARSVGGLSVSDSESATKRGGRTT
jgi:hypothetical protein